MKDTVIVLDLGTTNSKTTLFDAEGSAVAQSSCPTPVVYAGERMEVEPEKLWENIRHITRSMLRETPNTFVKAIVISSMASTLIPLDAAGSPLYNAISWSDMRTKEYCDDYMSRFVQGFHIADCGQYPLTQYSGFKLQWLRDHEPGIYGKTQKWVNISEIGRAHV